MYKLVITKGYRERATTIEGQNTFAPMLCFVFLSFMWQMVKTYMIRLRVIEGPNAHDQIVLCTFDSFLVEIQTKCWLHTWNTFIITTWRLGLWATRGAYNKTYFLTRTVPTRVSYCFVRADEQPARAFKNRCKCTSWKQKIVDSTLGEKSKAAKCNADKWLINAKGCWVIVTLGIDWAIHRKHWTNPNLGQTWF